MQSVRRGKQNGSTGAFVGDVFLVFLSSRLSATSVDRIQSLFDFLISESPCLSASLTLAQSTRSASRLLVFAC